MRRSCEAKLCLPPLLAFTAIFDHICETSQHSLLLSAREPTGLLHAHVLKQILSICSIRAFLSRLSLQTTAADFEHNEVNLGDVGNVSGLDVLELCCGSGRVRGLDDDTALAYEDDDYNVSPHYMPHSIRTHTCHSGQMSIWT